MMCRTPKDGAANIALFGPMTHWRNVYRIENATRTYQSAQRWYQRNQPAWPAASRLSIHIMQP
jgi:hypothetical protein